VNQFDSAGGRERKPKGVDPAGVPGAVTVRRGGRVGGGQGQDRAQPLAAGEHAIAHRLAHDSWAYRRRRQPPIQRLVHLRACALHEVGE